MAAVIVPKNSAANAVPDDASIPPNFHPYIKVTVEGGRQNGRLRHKSYGKSSDKNHFFQNQNVNFDFDKATITRVSVVTN
jgi:outer membrane protein OmpA-like peptidoglycan-associated protein